MPLSVKKRLDCVSARDAIYGNKGLKSRAIYLLQSSNQPVACQDCGERGDENTLRYYDGRLCCPSCMSKRVAVRTAEAHPKKGNILLVFALPAELFYRLPQSSSPSNPGVVSPACSTWVRDAMRLCYIEMVPWTGRADKRMYERHKEGEHRCKQRMHRVKPMPVIMRLFLSRSEWEDLLPPSPDDRMRYVIEAVKWRLDNEVKVLNENGYVLRDIVVDNKRTVVFS